MKHVLAMFIGIVSVPFVLIQSLSQGGALVDRFSPVLDVEKIERVDVGHTAIVFHNVHWHKLHDCLPQGILYLSTKLSVDGGAATEVLFPLQKAHGEPYAIQTVLRAGERMVVPETTLVATPAVLDTITDVRFVMPCQRPFFGETDAYSNTIHIPRIGEPQPAAGSQSNASERQAPASD